jgi:hypothetical protein
MAFSFERLWIWSLVLISRAHETRRATPDPSDEGIDDTLVSVRRWQRFKLFRGVNHFSKTRYVIPNGELHNFQCLLLESPLLYHGLRFAALLSSNVEPRLESPCPRES